jgi:DNA polymerase-3 subunit alpha
MTSSPLPFVNLHVHTGLGSPFDGLDTPVEMVNAAIELGMNSIAITEHGNMNSLGDFVNHVKKINREREAAGEAPFRPIYGVEAYYISDIGKWNAAYEEFEMLKATKQVKKIVKKRSTADAAPAPESPVEEESDDEEEESMTDATTGDLTDLGLRAFGGYQKVDKKYEHTREFADVIMDIKERRHIILLAKNEVGLNNLFRIVSLSHMEPYFYQFPRVDFEMLREHREGLIVSTACYGGLLADSFRRSRAYIGTPEEEQRLLNAVEEIERINVQFHELFGDDYYNEIQFNGIPGQLEANMVIIDSARRNGIKIIATGDAHIPKQEQWETREIYRKLRWMRSADDVKKTWHDDPFDLECQLWLMNGNDMYKNYLRHCPTLSSDIIMEAFENTVAVADQIEFFYPDSTIRLPSFCQTMPDADEELAIMAEQGLSALGLSDRPEYVERLCHELDVIWDRGFSRYFLTMKLITDHARASMICGPARGSGGASLVAYCLGITEMDPIKFNLDFARFLTKQTHGYPDIDFDVENPEAFKRALIEEWGADKLVFVSNWNKLGIRSVIKDLAKFFGISFIETNKVTTAMFEEIIEAIKRERAVRDRERVQRAMSLQQQQMNGDLSDEEYLLLTAEDDEEDEASLSINSFKPTVEQLALSPTYRDFIGRYPQIQPHIETLMGQVRDVATHAGGIIIGDDLPGAMPLICRGAKDKRKLQTPWPESGTNKTLESMGHVKFDVLGLNTLQMIHDCIGYILLPQYREQVNDQCSDPRDVPFEWIRDFYDRFLRTAILDLDDANVWDHVFAKGNWLGIFQFTSEGMQEFCKSVCPENIDELSAVTSIYRPGPMGADVHIKFAEAKSSGTAHYLNDIHREITEKTFGYLVFQEQLGNLVSSLGRDISAAEGHLVRKLLTSKGEKQIKQAMEYEDKFIAGCLDKGIPEITARELWSDIKQFAGYGFNKSHATGYSLISFQCAWLLTYFPAEWACAYLNNEIGSNGEELSKVMSDVRALSLFGYSEEAMLQITSLDINLSGSRWTCDPENMTLTPPLSMVKGVGMRAAEELLAHRPIARFEDLISGEVIPRRIVTKKATLALLYANALDGLLAKIPGYVHKKQLIETLERDAPFKSMAEFYSALAARNDTDYFLPEEELDNLLKYTGLFPVNIILRGNLLDDLAKELDKGNLCGLEDLRQDEDARFWFIVLDSVQTHTRKDQKPFYRIRAINGKHAEWMVFAFGELGKPLPKIQHHAVYICNRGTMRDGQTIFTSAKSLKLFSRKVR